MKGYIDRKGATKRIVYKVVSGSIQAGIKPSIFRKFRRFPIYRMFWIERGGHVYTIFRFQYRKGGK